MSILPNDASYLKKINILYPDGGHPYHYATAILMLRALEELANRNSGSYPNFGSFDPSAYELFNFDISTQVLIFIGCAPPAHLMPHISATSRCVIIGCRPESWASIRATPIFYVESWNQLVECSIKGNIPPGHVILFSGDYAPHEKVQSLFYNGRDSDTAPGLELLYRSYTSSLLPQDNDQYQQALFAALTRTPARRSIAGVIAMAGADKNQAAIHSRMISGWSSCQVDTIRSLVNAAVQSQVRTIRLLGIDQSLEICQAPAPLAFPVAQALLLRSVGKPNPLGIAYYDTPRGREFVVATKGDSISAGRVAELFPSGRGDDYVGYFRLPHIDSSFILNPA